MSTTRARRSTPWLPLAATVSRYGLVGLALASVLSIAVGVFAAKAGDVQADRSAERAAAVVGGSVVAPLVTPALDAGDRAALEPLRGARRATGPRWSGSERRSTRSSWRTSPPQSPCATPRDGSSGRPTPRRSGRRP